MLSLLVEVVTEITLPIVMIAALGALLQMRARFDVRSLNRLLIYATLPCFLIVTLANAELPLSQVQEVALFAAGQYLVLLAAGWSIGRLLGLEPKARAVIGLAFAFPNSGNFGIPLVELAFGNQYVVHQAVITATHTVLILLTAPVLFGSGGGPLGHLKAAFQTPLIPALAIGLLLNGFEIQLPAAIETPLSTMGQAYVGVALFALGAQLADGDFRVPIGAAGLGLALRLVAAPLLTALALLVIDLPATVEDILLVGSAAPVGVLLTIFAIEFRGNVQLSSALVMTSTLLSPLVVTAVLILARLS